MRRISSANNWWFLWVTLMTWSAPWSRATCSRWLSISEMDYDSCSSDSMKTHSLRNNEIAFLQFQPVLYILHHCRRSGSEIRYLRRDPDLTNCRRVGPESLRGGSILDALPYNGVKFLFHEHNVRIGLIRKQALLDLVSDPLVRSQ